MIQDLAVASDHAGYELKQFLIKNLKDNLNIIDFGTNNSASCDFPDYAKEVCNYILENKTFKGLLICGSGVGMSIAANKIHGIRASNVTDEVTAIQSVEHNDVNVLCLGSNNVSKENALSIVKKFLISEFIKEDKYIRRVKKLEN
jgi:ribose 5-phosphate isomerase B